MKGQLEISYQWIFVLLAGGTFLVLFFFAIRSCTTSGEARMQTLSVTRAASEIGGATWYPRANTSLSVPDVSVSCPVDTITLTTVGDDPARGELDRVPAFLPPRMRGKVRIVTRDAQVPSSPPILVGSMLYAIDDRMQYFLISDAARNGERITGVLGPASNIRTVSSGQLNAELAKVPSSATAAVIATFDQLPNVDSAGSVPVYVVQIDDATHTITFYARSDGSLQQIGRAGFTGENLIAGAVIAGRYDNFRCAKANFAMRAKYLTAVLRDRAGALQSEEVSAYCKARLGEVRTQLGAIEKSQQDQLLQMLLLPGTLSSKQLALYQNACPVIG